MAIPDFQMLMLPTLMYAAKTEEHTQRQLVDHLAAEFDLSTEELEVLLPSGTSSLFYNRVGWARTHLKQAALLAPTKYRHLKITDRGRQVLQDPPERIDMKFLAQFPEYQEFRARKKIAKTTDDAEVDVTTTLSPDEALEEAYLDIRQGLAKEILDNVLNSNPGFFETLVVDLLVAMGYGGSQSDAARAIGRSGDEGIDGIIDEDKLGLDSIYIQAKRWTGTTVGRPEIQKFVGALHGKRARKGIFITTSQFSEKARAYASLIIDKKVVLIDGDRLAELMIDYDVGVTTVVNYSVKRLDNDYFVEALE